MPLRSAGFRERLRQATLQTALRQFAVPCLRPLGDQPAAYAIEFDAVGLCDKAAATGVLLNDAMAEQ